MWLVWIESHKQSVIEYKIMGTNLEFQSHYVQTFYYEHDYKNVDN